MTLDQIVFTDIYGVYHTKATERHSSQVLMEYFPVLDHMLGHKIFFNKFERLEIIQICF